MTIQAHEFVLRPRTGLPRSSRAPLGLGGIGETVMLSSVEQYGITWEFDKEYECGQFITGDYWVIGPVTITDITRPNNDPERDGSMVNPMSGGSSRPQGFDSRGNAYDDSLNVANYLPLTVQPVSSLVSKISNPTGGHDTIDDAAVLTVLDTAPSATAFRPPYSGDRKIIHDWNDVDLSPLLSLPLVPSATASRIQWAKNAHARPWVALYAYWKGIQELIPSNNMPTYGRNIASTGNDVAMMLLLDIPQSDKEEIAKGFIQTGIDLHENLMNGWRGGGVGGGLSHGFKLPGILAGVLLNNTEMKEFHIHNNTRIYSMEDSQIEYLTQELIDANHSRHSDPDDNYYQFFDDIPLGTPIWLERGWNWADQIWHNLPGGGIEGGYMICCTTNATVGSALVVRLLGIENLWNYDPFLEWVDFYQGYNSPTFYADDWRSESWHFFWSRPFAEEMWLEYRGLADEL